MYTLEVDGIEIKAKNIRPSDSTLFAAICLAAQVSFQESRAVTLTYNGQPYRRVSVEFIGAPLRK